jgi:hypothetical protein
MFAALRCTYLNPLAGIPKASAGKGMRGLYRKNDALQNNEKYFGKVALSKEQSAPRQTGLHGVGSGLPQYGRCTQFSVHSRGMKQGPVTLFTGVFLLEKLVPAYALSPVSAIFSLRSFSSSSILSDALQIRN